MLARGMDGVIIASASSLREFEDLLKPSSPMAFVSAEVAAHFYRKAVFDMVEAFCNLGHRRIAFLSGLSLKKASHYRYRDFMDALHIYGMEMLGKAEDKEDTFRIKIRCGGGTYIRSLARDIAAALGTKAVMSALRRTQSGIFTLDNALPFSFFEAEPSVEELEKYLIPTESVLPFEGLSLNEKQEKKLLQGQQVRVECPDGMYKIYQNESFYGLAEVQDGRAKAKTKLC